MPVTKTFDLSALSDETLNIGSSFSRLDIYVGHLKRDLKCKALRQYHFLLSDCDEYGRLVKTDVFVQFLCVKSRGSATYALLCHTCYNKKQAWVCNKLRPYLITTYFWVVHKRFPSNQV